LTARHFELERSQKDLKGRAVRGAAAKLLSNLGGAAGQLLSGVILARLLVPDDFGLVAMVTAYTMILADVGELGLGQAVVQAEKLTHEQVSKLFWINVGLSAGMAVLFSALSPVLVWFYEEPRLQPIAITISIGFIFKGLGAQHLGLLNRGMRFSEIAALEMAGSTVSIALAVTLAWFGWGYWALAVRRVVVHLVTCIGAWSLSGWKPGFHVRAEGTGPLIRYGAYTFGAQALFNARQNIDKVLIGWRYGAMPLGLYDRAQQLFVLPFNQLTSPLSSVAVSTLSRLRNERQRYHRYYLEAISLVALVGMMMSAVVTVVGQDAVVLVLGAQWRESGVFLTAFGPGVGMLLLSSAQNWLHLSLGRADRSLRWNLVVLVASALALMMGLLFGPFGVACAYSVMLHVLLGPGFWYAGKPIGLSVSAVASVVWRYWASALVAAALCWYLQHRVAFTSGVYVELNVLSRVLAVSILCVSVYLLCTVVFHGSTVPVSRVLKLAAQLAPWRRRPEASIGEPA